jgi:GH25 family lysozyme M1 (1,4-beta-N-acetylmuramidase)
MRASFLEAHTEFEGVGAHEFNRRYDPVDEGEHDASIIATPDTMPALLTARSLLSAVSAPRFGGADIAHYQHDAAAASGTAINWTALYAGSRDSWFATKLTQSVKYLDPTSTRSRQASRGVGFRHVGMYHWLSSTTDPEQQAAWYLSKLGELAPGEFAMLDDEEAGVNVAKTLGWLEYVEARTKRPAAVYTGAYVTSGTIWRSSDVRHGKYGPRPMILAAYTNEARAKSICEFDIHPWASWQFSSNGPVAGIVGRCDMNRVDDPDAYDLAAGVTTFASHPPTPQIPQERIEAPASTEKDDDMAYPITHSEAHDGRDPRWHFWLYDPATGTKRPANGTEIDVILAGSRASAPGLTEAQLAEIPDRSTVIAGDADRPLPAFTVTSTVTAQ